jgi:hypothetical protein
MTAKIKHLAWTFLAIPLAFSCTSSNNNSDKSTTKTVKDTVKQCYIADFEGDTAMMDIKVIDSVEVEGKLVIKYANKPHNDGIVRGKFSGDTLFVDYSFKTGNNTTQFSNPLAFLKKADTLKMGVGVIENTLGRSYFAKDKPINFERGKFSFQPTECK